MTEPFSPPLAEFLTLGNPGEPPTPWRDYLAGGIGEEDVPELIRMATDRELLAADEESDEVWAPLHAWRALGQLRANEAAGPLVAVLRTSEDDWANNDLPLILGMIGPAAIAPLLSLLDDPDERVQLAGMGALTEVARKHPAARDEVTACFTERLGRWREQSRYTNAFLIGELLDLDVPAAAPLMKEAFDADAVDTSWCGDWEDVQVELGLIAERTTPRPSYHEHFRLPSSPASRAAPTPQQRARGAAKARNRRKSEKASRKRNRRK